MQAEDSWLAGFFFFFFFRNFLTETFSETFPMVRFEPGTLHSASERLNHSAIPETVLRCHVTRTPISMMLTDGIRREIT